LGWELGILNGDGGKPKGMHWRTFKRLQVEHNVYVEASLAGMALRFGLVGQGMVGMDDLLNGDD
jgi:hypothetical protein